MKIEFSFGPREHFTAVECVACFMTPGGKTFSEVPTAGEDLRGFAEKTLNVTTTRSTPIIISGYSLAGRKIEAHVKLQLPLLHFVYCVKVSVAHSHQLPYSLYINPPSIRYPIPITCPVMHW
ncbi:hypothetical protein EVAR_55858_1 [Eumeta japonica]|uniref:Uncharacterized protein n=1 Tax=Eumeta variegata TaxID=151549 RepID=A0A4C1Z4B6_EUMVA|nr:hypothetical protein EVAR_55858_1 [Eumeta japonica]